MKRPLQTALIIVVTSIAARSQDVPLFTQKLTNSFLYNPAVAGNSIGSLTLSHRQFWSGALDAPSTNFFSVHTPFGGFRYGTGINFYQDQVGVNKNMYASAAFAYHVHINEEKVFSMGLSAEYNNQKLNPAKFDAEDTDDPLLIQNSSMSSTDFSFGLSLKSKYLTLGASANRLKAFIGAADSTRISPAFYSGTARLTLPVAGGRDLFEPIVTYRGFIQGSSQIDAGLFYTYNELVTLGGSYRTGGIVNATAAVRLLKRVTIGYSRDMFMGDMAKGLGSTNEFTLRFDFMNEAYYRQVKNARAINIKALALRRKTLSTYKPGGSPYRRSRANRKLAKNKGYMSPNYRMDSSRKLQSFRRKESGPSKRKH